jgi:hypothetical protein
MLSALLILQAREKKGQTWRGGITHGGENATPRYLLFGRIATGAEKCSTCEQLFTALKSECRCSSAIYLSPLRADSQFRDLTILIGGVISIVKLLVANYV